MQYFEFEVLDNDEYDLRMFWKDWFRSYRLSLLGDNEYHWKLQIWLFEVTNLTKFRIDMKITDRSSHVEVIHCWWQLFLRWSEILDFKEYYFVFFLNILDLPSLETINIGGGGYQFNDLENLVIEGILSYSLVNRSSFTHRNYSWWRS